MRVKKRFLTRLTKQREEIQASLMNGELAIQTGKTQKFQDLLCTDVLFCRHVLMEIFPDQKDAIAGRPRAHILRMMPDALSTLHTPRCPCATAQCKVDQERALVFAAIKRVTDRYRSFAQ